MKEISCYKDLLDEYSKNLPENLLAEMLVVYFDIQEDQRLHISAELNKEIEKFSNDPLYLLMNEKDREHVIQYYRLQRTKEIKGSDS